MHSTSASPPSWPPAYAATVRTQAAILTTLNEQTKNMQEQVEAHFGQHPDVEIIMSQPGLGKTLGARVLAEFGDDPHRYARRSDTSDVSPPPTSVRDL